MCWQIRESSGGYYFHSQNLQVHGMRRAGASLLANMGANTRDLQNYGSWASEKTAYMYVVESDLYKVNMARRIENLAIFNSLNNISNNNNENNNDSNVNTEEKGLQLSNIKKNSYTSNNNNESENNSSSNIGGDAANGPIATTTLNKEFGNKGGGEGGIGKG
jgi:hypothetical protein